MKNSDKKSAAYDELLNAMHKSKGMNDVMWDAKITRAKVMLEQTLQALDSCRDNDVQYQQYCQMLELQDRLQEIVASLSRLHCQNDTLRTMLRFADDTEKRQDAIEAARMNTEMRMVVNEETDEDKAED